VGNRIEAATRAASARERVLRLDQDLVALDRDDPDRDLLIVGSAREQAHAGL